MPVRLVCDSAGGNADQVIEQRAVFGLEVRADGDDRLLSGTVVRYGQQADLRAFRESIVAGAFVFDDVTLNIQHDRGRPVARTGAGLRLTDGPDDLRMEARLPETRNATDALEAVRAGLIRGLSVEMEVREQDWEDRPDGAHRIIRSANLLGIGLVDRPAYAGSEVEARARQILSQRPKAKRRIWY